MDYNQITAPGNMLMRVLKKIMRKSPLLPLNFKQETAEATSGATVTATNSVAIKLELICDNLLINKLFAPLVRYKDYVTVLLHGSYADDSTTAFSDIDDFIIIKNTLSARQLLKIIGVLNKIDMQFCRLDPLQHHGHWIASSANLANYDNSFMPLFILSEAKLVFGAPTIEARINQERSHQGLKNNILASCNEIKLLAEKLLNNRLNLYELKGLVGSFVLMPAFILQLQGIDVTKPVAISRAPEIFSASAQQLITWSSECRQNWGLLTQTRKFKLFASLSYLCFNPHLWRRFAHKYAPKIKSVELGKLSKLTITGELVDVFIRESMQHAKI